MNEFERVGPQGSALILKNGNGAKMSRLDDTNRNLIREECATLRKLPRFKEGAQGAQHVQIDEQVKTDENKLKNGKVLKALINFHFPCRLNSCFS